MFVLHQKDEVELVQRLLELHAEVGDGDGNKLAQAILDKGDRQVLLGSTLQAAEKALREGQRNVTGDDDPISDPNTTWAEPLANVRALMTEIGVEPLPG